MALFSRAGAGQIGQGGQRVALTRTTPEVSLTRAGSVTGTLRVNLHWNQRPEDVPGTPRTRGLLRPLAVQGPPLPQKIDLDLGCLWELADGSKGAVQALGQLHGSFNQPPYVRLDRDDRSGTASGETLFVNLDQARAIRRLLIFVYIYEGIPAFDQAGALVTLFPNSGSTIEVRLDERAGGARTCAVALIENTGDDLVVRRLVDYVDGFQAELDRAYDWGLMWARGFK